MKLNQFLIPLVISGLFCTVSCQKAGLKPVSSTADTAQKIVVVLGSSTAAGWGASTFDSSWVGRLKARIKADGKKIKVINLAVPGYTTYQTLPSGYHTAGRPLPDTNANVTKALQLKPALVLINLPSNDVANGYSDQEFLDNFYIITKTISKKSIPFVLTGTQPRNLAEVNLRNRLKYLNDSLLNRYHDSTNSYFSKLSSDGYQILPQYSYGDGIHLNNAGHKIIYQAFMNNSLFRKILNY
jgi:lysophospholipase L1-like esterase